MLQHQGVCHPPPTNLSFPVGNFTAEHLHLSNQAELALHSIWSQTSLPALPGSQQHPFCAIHSYEKHPDPISYSYIVTRSNQGRAAEVSMALHGGDGTRGYA